MQVANNEKENAVIDKSKADVNAIREIYDQMCLGIIQSLEKRPGVVDVRLLDRGPASSSLIAQWEHSNGCIIPYDFRNFLLTTDGLLLRWSVHFDGEVMPLGKMQINALSKLIHVDASRSAVYENVNEYSSSDDDENCWLAPTQHCSSSGLKTELDLLGKQTGLKKFQRRNSQGEISVGGGSSDYPYSYKENGASGRKTKSYFDCPVFELDGCDSTGKVCLVYINGNQNPEIWFLDKSAKWSFMAKTFTEYFRLMVMHLGLPEWQYAFSPWGLSPISKQWFHFYCPVRLAIDERVVNDDITHIYRSLSSSKNHDTIINDQDEEALEAFTKSSEGLDFDTVEKLISKHGRESNRVEIQPPSGSSRPWNVRATSAKSKNKSSRPTSASSLNRPKTANNRPSSASKRSFITHTSLFSDDGNLTGSTRKKNY
eukprot:Nk52_evm66s1737 gene=Nk52_evmTU66s1737